MRICVLVLLLGLFSLCSKGTAQSVERCDKLKSKFEVKLNDSGKFDVQLTVTGGNKPYTFYWLGENESVKIQNPKTANQKNLVRGKYIVVIKDKDGCTDAIDCLIE